MTKKNERCLWATKTKSVFVIFSTGASNKFEPETKVSLFCMNLCWIAKLTDKLDLHFCAFKVIEGALPGEPDICFIFAGHCYSLYVKSIKIRSITNVIPPCTGVANRTTARAHILILVVRAELHAIV